ncbi:tellurite resistance TerB C-terminal domain-containing protein [Pedobacter frigidisoli]|uniref:tellurite resistance TerB C-terminal domain-containing protein n=1 Tax=Pedobacter frigidisoli TaxID=2530455 RepID=UPI00292F957C|nr:tellurite resistance TerB C-terminal domain-containing protein [Pedobacter frigidisoli]
MLIFFIIVAIVIIVAASSKKKPKNNHFNQRPVPLKRTSSSFQVAKPLPLKKTVPPASVNSKALELSTKHFGWEWMQFVTSRREKLKVSNQEIWRVMAIGYSKMGVKPLEHLLISFMQTRPSTEGSTGVNVTADDYKDLHQSTYDLIKANRFSQDNVQAMLSLLAERGRVEMLGKKEELKKLTKVPVPTSMVTKHAFANAAPASLAPTSFNNAQQNMVSIEPKENNTNNFSHDESIIDVGDIAQRIDFSVPMQSTDQSPQPAYSGYDPDEYSLGKKYKKKLNLSTQEAAWLNKFYNYNNVFNAIEGAEIEIIKLYLLSLKLIVKRLKKEGTTLSQEIAPIKAKLAEFERSSPHYWEGYGHSMLGSSAEGDIYYYIYKKAEMVIRELWGHRRKISADFYSRSEEVKTLFYAKLGLITDEVIEHLRPTVGLPDMETEMTLNAASTTRWKDKFQELTQAERGKDQSALVTSLHELGKMNERNPSVEQIYYESSKFMASIDKMESLKFYLHYIWHDLHSVVVDNKQLNKTIQKKLFSNQEQLDAFTLIIDQLSEHRDLGTALIAVETIYKPRRKSIVLDAAVIEKVELQHNGTVAILSEYLKDEEEVYELKTTVAHPSVLEEALLSTEAVAARSEIGLNPVQVGFLDRFAESFEVGLADAENYAMEHGVFKNQLIDAINELCYEFLDDVLIEESAEGYEINPDYYKQILS